MKPNVGDGERLIRVLVGVYGMLLGFLFIQGAIGIVLGVIGLIVFTTGVTGWCGIYAALKKSTVKVEATAAESEGD